MHFEISSFKKETRMNFAQTRINFAQMDTRFDDMNTHLDDMNTHLDDMNTLICSHEQHSSELLSSIPEIKGISTPKHTLS